MSRHRQSIRHGFPGQRMFAMPRATAANAMRVGRGLGLLPTDAGFFPIAEQHRVERPTGSKQTIVIYCMAGRGWTEVGNRRFDVVAGQCVVIRGGRKHAYGASDSDAWTIHWMHLAGQATRTVETSLLGPAGDPVVEVGLDPALAMRFERLFDAASDARSADALLLASLRAGSVVERLIEARRRVPGAAADGRDRIAKALALMWQRVNGRVTLAELAEAAGLSASHFAATFRSVVGEPPLAHFGALQMRQAAYLLDETDLPIKAVAARLGFDDPLYFSRRFRKVHGVPPARYRDARAARPLRTPASP